ncbi:GPI-anchored surface protein, putative, partial [Bodo saltans]
NQKFGLLMHRVTLAIIITVAHCSIVAVAQAFSIINCSNVTIPIVLAPPQQSVQIVNCTRRINVTVSCGDSFDQPLAVEVVGGITVPQFKLLACPNSNGIAEFKNVMFSLRGVRQVAPVNFLTTSLFSFSPALTVANISIMVVDSILIWISPINSPVQGWLVVTGQLSVMYNVSIIVQKSSLTVSAHESLVTLVQVVCNSSQLITIMFESASLVIATNAVNSSRKQSVVDVELLSSKELIIAFESAPMTITVNESATFNFLRVKAVPGFGGIFSSSTFIAHGVSLLGRTNSSLDIFALTSDNKLIFSNAVVVVENSTFDIDITVGDFVVASTAADSTVFVIYCSATILSNVTLRVSAVALRTTKNLLITKKVPSFAVTDVGTISPLYVHSEAQNSSFIVKDSSLLIFEEGTYVVAPMASFALLGITFVYFAYSFIMLIDVTATSSRLLVANCSIAVSRSNVGAMDLLPSVQSGVFCTTLSAVLLSNVIIDSNVAVSNTFISVPGAYFFDNALVSVWWMVGGVISVAPGNFLNTELPEVAAFLQSLNVNIDFNNSVISVDTVTISVPFTSIVPAASDIGELRVLLGLVSICDGFSAHVTIRRSSITHQSPSTVSASATSNSLCVAPFSLGPVSRTQNISLFLVDLDLSSLSLICATAQVQMSGMHVTSSNVSVIGTRSVGTSSNDSSTSSSELWNAFRLAPTSSRYSTTVAISNCSIHLSNTSFTSYRSLFGNITTSQEAVALTTTSGVKNLAFVTNPMKVIVASCTSNRWNRKPLMYSNMLVAPDDDFGRQQTMSDNTTALVVAMAALEGSQWCTMDDPSYSVTALPPPPPIEARVVPLFTVAAASRASSAVSVVLLLSALTSSFVSISGALPLLQGVVGGLRLSARCSSVTANSSSSANDEDDPSNYVANDYSDNPLLLQLPSSTTTTVAPSLSYATGALLGNLLLLVVVGVMSHLLLRVNHWAAHPSDSHRQFQHLQRFFGDHGSREHSQNDGKTLSSRLKKVIILCCQYLPTAPLPASFMIVHGLLLQPTVGAAVACVVSSDRGAISVALAAVVGGLWASTPCLFIWLLCVRHSPFPLAAIAAPRVNIKRLRLVRVGRPLEWFSAEQEEWVAPSAACRSLKTQCGSLFKQFRGGRHWYFGIDALLGAATGAVTGAAQSVSSASACDAAVWGTASVGAIAVASLVTCALLRPQIVRGDFITTISIDVLAIVAEALLLAGYGNAAGNVSLVATSAALVPLVCGLLWDAVCCDPQSMRHDGVRPLDMSRGERNDAIVHSATTSAERRHPTNTQHLVAMSIDPIGEHQMVALHGLVEVICQKSNVCI